MEFPFKGKSLEDSEQIVSKKWSYDKFPLLLTPKKGCSPLTDVKIGEIQSNVELRYKLLADGRIFSLDSQTSDVLFNEGYTVDVEFIEKRV